MISRTLLNASRSRLPVAAYLHTSSVRRAPHTPDSYNKDSEVTPPPDEKIHRVDPDNTNVQKPHEHPSGPYSRVGAESAEYKHTDSSYDGENRYGGKENYAEDKGPETSNPDEGPAGKSSQGRKPEGR